MRRHAIVIALLAVMIAGCSALRLGYTQADIILGWRADSYFDLDADQRRAFSTRLDQLLAWHRYEQLPEYAQFLTAAIDKAQHGLKTEDVAWLVDGFRARYRVIVNRGITDAAEILATLTPEQLVALRKQFDKDNRKFASDHELDNGADKRKRARLKKMLEQIDYWAGSLTREQERKIAALLDPVPLIEHLRHQDRMRRQHEFIDILKTRQAKPEFAAHLHQWLLDWDHGRTPEYTQLSAEVFEQRLHFFVAVDKLLTDGQRQHVLARMQKYADDCKALAARPPARADAVDNVILALF